MSEFRYISFATPNYSRAARELRWTARRFNVRPYIYTPESPVVRQLRHVQADIMDQPRGAGFWLWKPAIILDALEACEDGDILLYTDVALHVIADLRPLIAVARDYPIVLFEQSVVYRDASNIVPQSDWTKRDCFVLLDADNPNFWGSQMLWAGAQMYRNCDQSRAFVRALLKSSSDQRTLTDLPNTLGLPNIAGFQGHRHDQSVLSILARKWHLPMFPDPTQFGPFGAKGGPRREDDDLIRPDVRYRQTFHLHRKFDRGILNASISKMFGFREGY
jgi:hypothetical protein